MLKKIILQNKKKTCTVNVNSFFGKLFKMYILNDIKLNNSNINH